MPFIGTEAKLELKGRGNRLAQLLLKLLQKKEQKKKMKKNQKCGR